MSSKITNLAVTVVGSAASKATGALFDKLQGLIGNGGRDKNCKFYYSSETGGSFLQVATKSAVNMVTSALKDEAVNQFNSLLNGKSKDILQKGKHGLAKNKDGYDYTSNQIDKQDEEAKKYGMIEVDGGTVYALDDWGCICPDALMLSIKTDKEVAITQSFPVYGNQFMSYYTDSSKNFGRARYSKTFSTKNVVWYDTTALITINSDKNIVVTRVQGRDYSRKELVSNGDIKFSVSGQITSGNPDIYPTEEIKKFIKVMQYKGIIHINNQVLDQFGIEYIVITDFSITPREGYKALQNYTFSAIGLQPQTETEVTEDTVTISTPKEVEAEEDSSAWMDMISSQLEGLKSMASDVFSQSAALATGILDNTL